MKNRTIFMSILILAAAVLTGCQKTTGGQTWITYYPDLVLEGDSEIFLDKGTAYEDPGYTAIMNGEDVTDQVVVTTDLDMNQSGYYTIVYSIANSDGFSSSAVRYVMVTDPNDPVEGIYYGSMDCTRDYQGTPEQFVGSFRVLVYSNGQGGYTVDDMFAGYYRDGRGYGAGYNMVGNVTVDTTTGVISLVNSHVYAWDDGLDALNNGKYTNDGTTVSLYWEADYASSMTFYVTLNKEL